MHAACAAAFAGSHMCHVSEYTLADSATAVPSSGAWLDYSASVDHFGSSQLMAALGGPAQGRYAGFLDTGNCGNWTETTYVSAGSTLIATGETIVPSGSQQQKCATTLPVACCASPYKERFRGFTTSTTSGAAGGRAMMNFQCASQFSGSHLCHFAEYTRAAPTASPPASGAWIDYSGAIDQFGSAQLMASQASVATARYVGFLDTGNCGNWTENTYVSAGSTLNATGGTITPAGFTNVLCSTARPLACCQ
jgi:hypothetical protein